MVKSKLGKLMYFLIAIGILAIGLGIGLTVFTDRIANGDVKDIMLIALLIAGGLLISVPAKIYLLVQQTQKK
jgi:hypothetical protein